MARPCSVLHIRLSVSLSSLHGGVVVHDVDITALNIKGRNQSSLFESRE